MRGPGGPTDATDPASRRGRSLATPFPELAGPGPLRPPRPPIPWRPDENPRGDRPTDARPKFIVESLNRSAGVRGWSRDGPEDVGEGFRRGLLVECLRNHSHRLRRRRSPGKVGKIFSPGHPRPVPTLSGRPFVLTTWEREVPGALTSGEQNKGLKTAKITDNATDSPPNAPSTSL